MRMIRVEDCPAVAAARAHVHMHARAHVHMDTRKGFTTHYRTCVYRRALCQVGKPILKRHRIFIPRCADSVPIRVYTVCCVLTALEIVPLGIWTTGALSMYLGRLIGYHVGEVDRDRTRGIDQQGGSWLADEKRKVRTCMRFIDSLLIQTL